jgi:hypothetical protein
MQHPRAQPLGRGGGRRRLRRGHGAAPLRGQGAQGQVSRLPRALARPAGAPGHQRPGRARGQGVGVCVCVCARGQLQGPAALLSRVTSSCWWRWWLVVWWCVCVCVCVCVFVCVCQEGLWDGTMHRLLGHCIVRPWATGVLNRPEEVSLSAFLVSYLNLDLASYYFHSAYGAPLGI